MYKGLQYSEPCARNRKSRVMENPELRVLHKGTRGGEAGAEIHVTRRCVQDAWEKVEEPEEIRQSFQEKAVFEGVIAMVSLYARVSK